MKIIAVIMALMLSGAVSAQLGISAGGSLLKGFGQPKPWGGLHFGIEVPRDDAISIYGRITHHFKQNSQDSTLVPIIAYDLATIPYSKNINAISSMNYTMIEGGTRYYIGNGYDFGWAAYGGTNIMLVFNSVKMQYDGYDQVLYDLPEGYERKGSIVSLGFGLGGGVKYSVAGLGTIYFDTGLSYLLAGLPSNQLASDQGSQQYSPLFFNFNLGFRKDLLW
jgi:hypothetical protein